MGAGAIHHVALRVADEAQQLDWRVRLIEIRRSTSVP